MPNHCYTHIVVSEKYNNKLEEISKVGLCRHYKPMPRELIKTTSPVWIVPQEEYDLHLKGPIDTEAYRRSPITKDIQKMLIEKYGADNWYDWAITNWGTKWGCYNNEYNDGQYEFTSAWGPVSIEIIELLSKDIPSFEYSYEEEQGWGVSIEFENGEKTNFLEWDSPNWEDTDNDDISFLPGMYQNGEGTYLKGYYSHEDLQEYLGSNFKDAVEEHK